MPHPLVLQLRFTRGEFARAWRGVAEEDAQRHFPPMNCISWLVGHLAWQEQSYFLHYGQGQLPLPEIDRQFAYGAPASTPTLAEVRGAWRAIIAAADPWLDTLTTATLQEHVISKGKPIAYIHGNLLQRVIYHYWFHTGEIMAIRQLLGHGRLPQYVGAIDTKASYRPEDAD